MPNLPLLFLCRNDVFVSFSMFILRKLLQYAQCNVFIHMDIYSYTHIIYIMLHLTSFNILKMPVMANSWSVGLGLSQHQLLHQRRSFVHGSHTAITFCIEVFCSMELSCTYFTLISIFS